VPIISGMDASIFVSVIESFSHFSERWMRVSQGSLCTCRCEESFEVLCGNFFAHSYVSSVVATERRGILNKGCSNLFPRNLRF
jgi:hypothetical protein